MATKKGVRSLNSENIRGQTRMTFSGRPTARLPGYVRLQCKRGCDGMGTLNNDERGPIQ